MDSTLFRTPEIVVLIDRDLSEVGEAAPHPVTRNVPRQSVLIFTSY
jgi:hypothetical protein